MKKYNVEITYAATGYIEVEENSEEEAVAKVENMDIDDILHQAYFNPELVDLDVFDVELEEK